MQSPSTPLPKDGADRSTRRLLAVLPLALWIAGCSGGGGDSPRSDATAVSSSADGASAQSQQAQPLQSGVQLSSGTCTNRYTVPPIAAETGSDPLLTKQWHLANDGTRIGTAGNDLGIAPAWAITRGENVRVAIVDDAVLTVHEDLIANAVPGASFDYRAATRGYGNPLPCTDDERHGTSIAGIIAARDGNGLGGRGVAPRSALVAYNALNKGGQAFVADALTRDNAKNDVYNNSWGPMDDGRLHPAVPLYEQALLDGTANGRGGLGSVFVFAAGNGGCLKRRSDTGVCVSEDDTNLDGLLTLQQALPVCAVDADGRHPAYGERGSNLLVCGPSGSITTTGVRGDYIDTFSGTSAAAPMVTGTVALMLSANPKLSWRDVRILLARTARRNDATSTSWQQGKHAYSHDYGFGTVNAAAAVAAARTFVTVGGSREQLSCGPYAATVATPIQDPVVAADGTLSPRPVMSTIDVSGCGIREIEFVEVRFTARATDGSGVHPSAGDLQIDLGSPNGTWSNLARAHECLEAGTLAPTNCGAWEDWRFGSARHLDEAPANAQGDARWAIRVADMVAQGRSGTFLNWSITLRGH